MSLPELHSALLHTPPSPLPPSSPSSLPFSPPPSPPPHPLPAPRSLHLTPSTAQEHVDIPVSDLARYDLVDNILVAHLMSDREHDKGLLYLFNLFAEERRRRDSPSGSFPMLGPTVTTSNHPHSAGTTQRIPDLVIGVTDFQSSNVSSPVGSSIDVIFEVTSHNRVTGLISKKLDYAAAGAKQYVIIDRDKPRKGKPSHHPHVQVGMLHGRCYRSTSYESGQEFPCTHIGRISVDRDLNPPDPSQATLENVEMKRRHVAQLRARERAAENESRREREQRQAAEGRAQSAENESRREREQRQVAESRTEAAGSRAEAAESEARRERRKPKRKEEKRRKRGIVVSSSSSESSPGKPSISGAREGSRL